MFPIIIDILGRGTYGYAIKPPLKLENINIEEDKESFIEYINKEQNDIGKVFIIDNGDEDYIYREELKELKLINELDKNNIFTVPLKGASIGYINEEKYDIAILNKFYKSIKLPEKKTNIHQIIQGNGGHELKDSLFENYKDNPITYIKFLNIFDKFLSGMLLLQNANKIHRDIKPPNVLFDGNKINLIDFGLTIDAKDIYSFTKDNTYMMKYIYIFFPPEYYICGYLYNDIFLKLKIDIEKLKIGKDITYDIVNEKFSNIKCKDSQFIIDSLINFKINSNTILHKSYIDFISNFNNGSNIEFIKIYKKNFYIEINNFVDNIINTIIDPKNSDKKVYDIYYKKIYNKKTIKKFDVYSLAFIILPFYKYLYRLKGKNELNIRQKSFLSYIFNNCANTNPYHRISIKNLKKLINIEIKNESIPIINNNMINIPKNNKTSFLSYINKSFNCILLSCKYLSPPFF